MFHGGVAGLQEGDKLVPQPYSDQGRIWASQNRDFARKLAVSWPDHLRIHGREALPPSGDLYVVRPDGLVRRHDWYAYSMVSATIVEVLERACERR